MIVAIMPFARKFCRYRFLVFYVESGAEERKRSRVGKKSYRIIIF